VFKPLVAKYLDQRGRELVHVYITGNRTTTEAKLSGSIIIMNAARPGIRRPVDPGPEWTPHNVPLESVVV
jgi:hypothetical protein